LDLHQQVLLRIGRVAAQFGLAVPACLEPLHLHYHTADLLLVSFLGGFGGPDDSVGVDAVLASFGNSDKGTLLVGGGGCRSRFSNGLVLLRLQLLEVLV
jgi:hypothetical protein